ncbi:odorant receptor 131-2-like [Mantella aurantiaca]
MSMVVLMLEVLCTSKLAENRCLEGGCNGVQAGDSAIEHFGDKEQRFLLLLVMSSIADIQRNSTQVAVISNHLIMRFFLLTTTLTCYIIFFYFLGIMLCIYFTSTLARQEVRYLLFAHMLVVDFIFLFLSLFLFLASYFPVKFPAVFCYTVCTITTSTLEITPYNLAAMSLERYVAICFPLRHRELCTLQRTSIVIAIIWVTGLLPRAVDLIVLILSIKKTFFSQNVVCDQGSFIVTSVQNIIKVVTYTSTFSLVGLIIIFTYIKIVLVAFRVGSGKSSVLKAGKTIILHAFQLLLCMSAFSYSIFGILFKDYIDLYAIINFCFFMCLPRFLSPFIYGMRDELFRKHIKKLAFCSFSKSSTKQAINK